MPTNRPTETRHRWTREEERVLLSLSRTANLGHLADDVTIGDATDAVYVAMGMPRGAVYAKLYDLHMRGRAPWLRVERESHSDFSAAFTRAVREMARTMRVEGVTDALVVVPESGPAEVQVVRRAETVVIPLEEEDP